MSGGTAARVGLAAGVPVLGLVVALFARVVEPAREIDHYATDIEQAALAIHGNLEGLAELERTHALATAVPDLAVAYLHKLGAA